HHYADRAARSQLPRNASADGIARHHHAALAAISCALRAWSRNGAIRPSHQGRPAIRLLRDDHALARFPVRCPALSGGTRAHLRLRAAPGGIGALDRRPGARSTLLRPGPAFSAAFFTRPADFPVFFASWRT